MIRFVKMLMLGFLSHFSDCFVFFVVFVVFVVFVLFVVFVVFVIFVLKNAETSIHVFHAVSMSNHRFFMSNDTHFHVPIFPSLGQHQCEFAFS